MTTTNNRTILESLDRHRSPSATEIYSTARTYLHNNSSENESEKTEPLVQRANNENIDSHKTERRKKHKQRLSGHRKRTASSETLVGEEIPPPQASERSRSVEISRIDRVEFERAKTENLLTSCDTSSLDSGPTGQSNSKLMTQSLGRGQSIPSVSQAIGREFLNSNVFNSNDAIVSDRVVDDSSTFQLDEATIQDYIGQTFPLVKNIDKDVVASSVAISNSGERKHPTSQPLPSQVATITRSNFHSYAQPPLSNNSGISLDESGTEKYIGVTASSGKKPKSSQKRQQASLHGVALASLDSTPNKVKELEQQKSGLQHFITPPRKSGESTSSQLMNSSIYKEKSTHNRIIDKISISGSNHPSRSSSPFTKGGSITLIEEENKIGSTLQNAADSLQSLAKPRAISDDKSTDTLKDEQPAHGNDRIVREKLQEAKAMNRQENSNGAVMYQFSLWKGVQKRDPIPDISLPKRSSDAGAETPIRATKDQVETNSQKKASKLRGPRAVIVAQDENISDHASIRKNSAPIKSEEYVEKKELNNKPTPIYPEITRQSPFALRKVTSRPSREGSDDEKYSDDGDEHENADNHFSGRAYAFRSMVGSCQTNNLSCGSLAETVQTEMGIPHLYTSSIVDSALSVGSLSSDDSDHDECMSIEESAILAVALESECSFISNDHEDVDQTSLSGVSQQILEPKFSLELSMEAISESIEEPVGPPLIKKREKSRTLAFDEENFNGGVNNVLVSASLPKLPTQKENTVPPARRRSSSSGHTQRIREMTSAAKLESPSDDLVDLLQESRKTDNSSPLLSEASEYDNFDDSHISSKNGHAGATADDQLFSQHNIARGVNAEVFSAKKSSIQFQNDELYSIHDFQWKRGSEILGEGSFGQVFKGMNCSTGELLAVKQICLTDGTEEEVATLRQEIDLMDSLKHPNIVRYVGTSVSSRYLFIVLEYVPGGSVAGMLSQFGSFSEVLIRRLVNQIMQGVDYLHQKGIVHRDIKGANVLVTDIGVAKLADFGCSKQLAGLCTTSLEESMRTIRGSVPWMAPEVIKQTGHGRSADIWSVGATIIEMATAKPPWQEFSNNLAALFHVATSKHPPPIPPGLSKECADFIGRCMKIDPKERATAKELLMDPFLLALIVTSKVE